VKKGLIRGISTTTALMMSIVLLRAADTEAEAAAQGQTIREETPLADTTSTDTATETAAAETSTADASSTDTAAEETSATASTEQTVIPPTWINGNNWIYDRTVPIDMYASDETTTTQIQVVAPESSFQVTYTQEDSEIVSAMTDVLSALGTDLISRYSSNVSVVFLLPIEMDTSNISASSFTLEGFNSLFEIKDVSVEQYTNYSVSVIEVEFQPKTSYTSIETLLSSWQENTSRKITLSGLSVPSSYSVGDVFYISAIPLGTVNVKVDDIVYQFEGISSPDAGDDGMTDTFQDTESEDFRAHVTFQVGLTETEAEETADAAEDTEDTSDTAADNTEAAETATASSTDLKVVVDTGASAPGDAAETPILAASEAQTGDKMLVFAGLAVPIALAAVLSGLYFEEE
jgi:hypothetical protein